MKKYTKPELTIASFEARDFISLSAIDTIKQDSKTFGGIDLSKVNLQ